MKVFVVCIPDIFIGSSLEILRDWISLIDENGWVAREQILGEEARSKVIFRLGCALFAESQ